MSTCIAARHQGQHRTESMISNTRSCKRCCGNSSEMELPTARRNSPQLSLPSPSPSSKRNNASMFTNAVSFSVAITAAKSSGRRKPDHQPHELVGRNTLTVLKPPPTLREGIGITKRFRNGHQSMVMLFREAHRFLCLNLSNQLGVHIGSEGRSFRVALRG
jgi:hypothetical protein